MLTPQVGPAPGSYRNGALQLEMGNADSHGEALVPLVPGTSLVLVAVPVLGAPTVTVVPNVLGELESPPWPRSVAEDRTESVLDDALDHCQLFQRKGTTWWVSLHRHRAVTGGVIPRLELTW